MSSSLTWLILAESLRFQGYDGTAIGLNAAARFAGIMFVAWGGAMGATFTVGLTLVGERFRDVELVAPNAVHSLLFGLGGLAGPFLASVAMDRFGPPGFPASLFAVAALCPAARARRGVPPGADRRPRIRRTE